jgi:hypothetical protein
VFVVEGGAEFSPCRTWRYRLWRRWDTGPVLLVVGLNPSTADETRNDPTIRRCIGYAHRWGFGALEMLNLFSFRATEPRDLVRAEDPIGPETGRVIAESCGRVGASSDGAVLAAWGAHARHPKLADWTTVARTRLEDLLPEGVACLGFTNEGEPRHPLYLRLDAHPVAFLGDGGPLVRGLSPED